jgi:hypothetical protein
MFLQVFLAVSALGFSSVVEAASAPHVQLGETNIIGTTGPSTVEFFGGTYVVCWL